MENTWPPFLCISRRSYWRHWDKIGISWLTLLTKGIFSSKPADQHYSKSETISWYLVTTTSKCKLMTSISRQILVGKIRVLFFHIGRKASLGSPIQSSESKVSKSSNCFWQKVDDDWSIELAYEQINSIMLCWIADFICYYGRQVGSVGMRNW